MPNTATRADTLTIKDTERIRALAHPLRLTLLDLLDDVGEATATRFAELTGESVASCSFHLRMLAKYGYIEAAERRGREKPWRATTRHREARPDHSDHASIRAVEALAALTVDREAERIRAWLATTTRETPQWLDATTVNKSGFWATAEELAQLSRDVQALTDRFAGRADNASARPAGARAARLFAVVNPDPPASDDPGRNDSHVRTQS